LRDEAKLKIQPAKGNGEVREWLEISGRLAMRPTAVSHS